MSRSTYARSGVNGVLNQRQLNDMDSTNNFWTGLLIVLVAGVAWPFRTVLRLLKRK